MPVEERVPVVRKFIFDEFLERGVPPILEEVMGTFSLSRDEATEVFRALEAARHVALVKGTARILMAFPFSAVATPFRSTIGGRRYFANCAWDAIAFHAMLGEEVAVESYCHHCAEPISMTIRDGRAVDVRPAEAVVYFALPPARWWDDIINTCSNTMVFFASPEHGDASSLCAADGAGATLTPDQVLALSIPLYGRRMEIDYARPPKDELLALFASLGFTGPFWAL